MHSKAPLLGLIVISGSAIAAFASAILYTLNWNPEISFWGEAAKRKQQWARSAGSGASSKVLIAGGSSCAFSIDAAALSEKLQIPSVNMGLAANFGTNLLAVFAVQEAREGDFVILSFEPETLADERKVTKAATQLAYSIHQRSLLLPFDEPRAWSNPVLEWVDLRPGGKHTAAMLTKFAARAPMFRYSIRDLRPGGLITTDAKAAISGPPSITDELPKATMDCLRRVRAHADANGISIYYSIPWFYCPPSEQALIGQQVARLLSRVREEVPVLKDPTLGIVTDSELFSDTGYHLNRKGVVLRTAALARQLSGGETWTKDELDRLAAR